MGLVSLLPTGPSDPGDTKIAGPEAPSARDSSETMSGCWGRTKSSSSSLTGAAAPFSSASAAASTLAEMVETIERREGEADRVVGLK